MGLFDSSSIIGIDEEFVDDFETKLIEDFIVDEVTRMNDEERKNFLESEQCKALIEANVLRKPTMMRLSKADDQKRRMKLAAYRIAKQRKDPLYTKLLKYRGLWKQTSQKITDKYGTKGAREAKNAQLSYIKNYSKNVKAGKVKVPTVTK